MTESETMPMSAPWKIALDVRMIRHSGIGQYIQHLLDQYQNNISSDFHYILFGNPKFLTTYANHPNFNIEPYIAPIYKIQEQIAYPSRKFYDTDLLHVPHYNIPIRFKGKLVITVHDLIHYLFPETISNPLGRKYSHFLMKKAFQKASRIIAISQSTKNDLIKYFHIPENKIDVIYYGKPDLGKTKMDELKPDIKPYILHVGIDKPHKNVKRLIEAFALFLNKTKSDYRLVLIGPKEPINPDLKKVICDHKLESKIIFPGYLPQSEISSFYTNADLFVFPSLYEGFGLPPLEAMSTGIPVIASNTSSLPEVLGDAALLIDPTNVESIAQGMENLLTDSSLRLQLIEKGKKRITEFSWKESAGQTQEVYRKVLQD